MNKTQSTEAVRQWRAAQDVVTVVLATAAQSGVIAEVTSKAGSYERFMEMTDAERAELATMTGNAGKAKIAAACKFAGTSYESARAALLDDTPERRAMARNSFNF